MPRTLIVVRHAKADTAARQPDAERPLTEQGRSDAREAGRWLSAIGVLPDLVLCSPARRARQTWEAMAPELASRPEVRFPPQLYEDGPDTLLTLLNQTADTVGMLLLIGHNPTVHQLIQALTDADEVARGLPAGTVAVMEIEGAWAEVAPGAATLTQFNAP